MRLVHVLLQEMFVVLQKSHWVLQMMKNLQT